MSDAITTRSEAQPSLAGPSLACPSLAWMHATLALSGLGTALLGPILPVLAHQWHMVDSQSGLLMAAKFCGAFVGGVTVTRHLRNSLLWGLIAATIGFAAFAIAPRWQIGCLGLALGGFGIGRMITATNILAGRKFTTHRGSGLALLNFSFAAGAMLSALGAAWLLPRFALRPVLECFAAAFALVALWLWLETHQTGDTQATDQTIAASTFDPRLFLYFATLLFLYGGLETCLSGWLTTFALRYGDRSFALSEYTTLLLWLSLTLGRAVSSALMLRIREKTLQRFGLAASTLCVAALAFAHGGIAIAVIAVLLGLSFAPFFPATFALLVAEGTSANQAGMVIAASGLGAALLPWLMGIVSTHTGSLSVSLILPLLASLLLFALGFLSIAKPRGQDASKA